MGAVVSTQSTWDHIFDKNSSFIKNRRGVVNRTPYTRSDQRYMKLWVLIRFMSNNSNFNRIIFSYTLLWRRFISLLKGQAYLSRCKLRMNTTNYSRQRRQFFLRLFISPYWPGPILRVLNGNSAHLDHRSESMHFANAFFTSESGLRGSIGRANEGKEEERDLHHLLTEALVLLMQYPM